MLFHGKTYESCSQKGRLLNRADGPYHRHDQNGLFDRVIRAEKSALCSGRLLSTTHEAKASKRFRPPSKAKQACNAWCTRFAMVEQSRFNCRPINDTHTKLSELALKGGGDIRPSLRSSIEFSAIRTMAHIRTYVRWIRSSSDTRHECMASTCAHCGAVDKPYPIFKLRDKIEEKTGWDGYADTDRR